MEADKRFQGGQFGSISTRAGICAAATAAIARSIILPIVSAITTVGWIRASATAVVIGAHGYSGSYKRNRYNGRRSLILRQDHRRAVIGI